MSPAANNSAAYVDRATVGVTLIVSAVLLFSVQDGIAKYLSMVYAPLLIAWMRFLAQVLMLTVFYGPKLKLGLLRTRVPQWQFLRVICMVGANLSFLVGLRYIPLGEATAIFFLSPILVVLFSRWLLSERIVAIQMVSIVVSLIGVFLIVRPGAEMFTLAALLPIASALFIACYQMLTRKVMATDNAAASMFLVSLGACLVLAIPLPFFWTTLPLSVWVIVFIQAVFALVGHLMMTNAYRFASAAVLAPFTYFQIVFSAIVGFLAFDHLPDLWSGIGIGLVTAGGLIFVVRLRRAPSQA
jgi:drug/metabolite transporter (DMT)-like permease